MQPSETKQLPTVKLHHGILDEFQHRIVDRYFNGDLGKALTEAMLQAVNAEELYQSHLIEETASQ